MGKSRDGREDAGMWYHDFGFPFHVGQWRGEAVFRITRARWAKDLLPGWSTAIGGPFAVGFHLRATHNATAKVGQADRFPGLADSFTEGRG